MPARFISRSSIEAAVSTSNIPIAVHLDHGDSFELVQGVH